MYQLSTNATDRSEQSLLNQKNNSYEDASASIGTADTLKRAMTVHRLSDMLDCIKDMKSYASTIEKDLPVYLETTDLNRKTAELLTNDFLLLEKQPIDAHSYILLHELLEQKPKSKERPERAVAMGTGVNSLLERQIDTMKHIIAAQPSALEGIYLEALLNPDQWQFNHQLPQASSMDVLTSSERKRLDKILTELR